MAAESAPDSVMAELEAEAAAAARLLEHWEGNWEAQAELASQSS